MRSHGRKCKPICRELATPSPIDRERPPAIPCTHCGAEAGIACTLAGPGNKRPLKVYGRFHPSRLEVASWLGG